MFVPRERHDEAAAHARAAAEAFTVGAPDAPGSDLGPVVSDVQFGKIQELIASGIAEGARLVTGGPGRPDGLERGYYVRPTIFADVKLDMRIAREEIFGTVLSIVPYDDLDEAVRQANATVYGLASYIQAKDIAKGPCRRAAHADRQRPYQLPGPRPRRSLRRLPPIRQWPGICGVRARRLPRDQGRLGLRRRLTPEAQAPEPA